VDLFRISTAGSDCAQAIGMDVGKTAGYSDSLVGAVTSGEVMPAPTKPPLLLSLQYPEVTMFTNVIREGWQMSKARHFKFPIFKTKIDVELLKLKLSIQKRTKT
jgi:hypothetical protein